MTAYRVYPYPERETEEAFDLEADFYAVREGCLNFYDEEGTEPVATYAPGQWRLVYAVGVCLNHLKEVEKK